MSRLMVDHLAAGGAIALAIAHAVITVGEERRDAVLASKAERVLSEHATVVALLDSEPAFSCLNRLGSGS